MLIHDFSSLNFAAGFFGVRTYQSDYHLLIVPETGSVNNTLAAPETCSNANNPDIGGIGTTLAEKWMAKYLVPATRRLAPMIQGVNLTIVDVFEMQMTCVHEVNVFFWAFPIEVTDIRTDGSTWLFKVLRSLHRRRMERV